MKLATWLAAACVATWPAVAIGQDFSDLRKLFEQGKYQDVADKVKDMNDPAPRVQYLAGQAYQKLNESDRAKDEYRRLADGPDDRAWTFVGRSMLAVLDKNYDEALTAAKKAASLDEGLAEAHYQIGLAEAFKQNYANAATAFDKATELDPQFGYAHYQAGLAHYKNKRTDRMASHFEMFLKVAPQAPERPEVESILRTLRRKH